MDYDFGYDIGYYDCMLDIKKLISLNIHKFGVDTSDTNQVYDFWDKLGFDPYTLEPK